jgi:bacterioferritin (cytochrome b1)
MENLPYPMPDEENLLCRDKSVVRRLYLPLRDEMVAISDSLYRAIITEKEYPRLSALFGRIADEGLEHYRLLGRAITILGGNPTLRVTIHPEAHHLSDKGGDDIRDRLYCLLNTAVREKETSCLQYERLAAYPSETILPILFCRLAADEATHKQLLIEAMAEL